MRIRGMARWSDGRWIAPIDSRCSWRTQRVARSVPDRPAATADASPRVRDAEVKGNGRMQQRDAMERTMTDANETPRAIMRRVLTEEIGDAALVERIIRRYNAEMRRYQLRLRLTNGMADLERWRAQAEDARASGDPGRRWVIRKYERLRQNVERWKTELTRSTGDDQ